MEFNKEILNFTQHWVTIVESWHLELFCIPATVITLATLVANPVLLCCIFTFRALRQETRYLLVANTLVADMLFLVLNLTTTFINSVEARIPWIACELMTIFLVTAYSCAILTVTVMVVDTFAAVNWPLHYHDFLTPARTYSLLVVLWVLVAIFPLTLFIVKWENSTENVFACLAVISLGLIQNKNKNMEGIYMYFLVCAIACSLVIFYCYIRLYMVTRMQGIWQTRFSRARVTVLAHGVLLFLYFVPGFLFALELLLFHKKSISPDVNVWISTLNGSFFMLLPRALAPYLYGLRYREISDYLTLLLHRQRRLSQITLS
ncbi:probable G-protein coupled receptor 148 [Oryzias melastigma]|uniref:probable G-protein coupled receptor 148 n=1 Tax=Oryzias melastigma TaxID=30732 RepID=UPI000CF7F90B|nr:probable G-protein coupled receptor 148 [Oryzias melastigma]